MYQSMTRTKWLLSRYGTSRAKWWDFNSTDRGVVKAKNNNPREGKYFTYITGGQTGVWGVDTFHYSPKYVFLCEGIFDACQLHNFDLPAIAVLGNNPLHIVPWLKALGRRVIAIPDDDDAGRNLGKLAHETLSVAPFLNGVHKGGRDLGRLKPEQVEQLLAPYL